MALRVINLKASSMSMRRQHYEMIAQVLRAQKPQGQFPTQLLVEQWQRIVENFCITLKADNDKFRPYTFRAACGM